METRIYELLSILKYPISDNLFKDKIGTGEELRDLVKAGILEIDGCGYYQVNYNSDKIIHQDSLINQKELHENIIETYYLKNINKEINSDYSIFISGYLDYINLSYHYRELGDFNSAIENIFYIAKKLTFWGFGDELLVELDKYKEHKLNVKNSLWRQYYICFCNLIGLGGEIDADEFFDLIESIEQQDLTDFNILYLEIKNLEGIYFKQVKNDNTKAITIFEKEIKRYKELNNNLSKELRLAYARILENLAFSINKSNVKKSNEYFAKAKEIFEEFDDNYELAKLHLLKLCLPNNDNKERMISIINEHNKLIGILNKHNFPDIERNLFNILSEEFFTKDESFDKYMETKIQALIRDLVLYFENFEIDFIDILHKIEETLKNGNDKIEESIDLLLKFLDEVGLIDELYFIEGIKAHLSNKDTNGKLSKISNKNLKKLAEQYIEELSIN